ncbi:MAG: methyl-accepting chemotaxis protein [Lachnospiraceae bacterium]|nr:methyl-accepting chemotaxis protein [Lachnospiraceae bacterium]
MAEVKEKKGLKFNFHKMLLMFALIPCIVSVLVVTIFLVNESQTEIEEVAHNYMYSMAASSGQGLYDQMSIQGKELALSSASLAQFCGEIKLEGISSSYCYVADAAGTMLYHPTAEKIGQPVTNSTILDVCAQMSSGKSIATDVVSYEFNGETKYASYFVAPDNSFVLVISADKSDVMADVDKIVLQGSLIAVACVVVFIVIATLFSMKVVKPLTSVVKAMSDTAEGNLNADTNIHSTVFETKQLITSAKTLQQVLQKTIGDTQNISDELKTGAESVAHLAEQSKEGSDQISSAMEDLAQGATSMAQNVQSINEQVIDMGFAIDSITANTDQLVVLSNNIREANIDATEYINKVSASSEKSVSAVQDIKEQINDTNDSVIKIKDAADMIGSIAQQTNLLALNASIEAARAGEAGKGFAVVAQEIKNLSEQSNNSAEEIRQVVSEVIAQSSKSVSLVGEVVEIITEEQNFINETEKKFEILNNEIEQSLEEIQNISDKVSNLDEAKVSITSSVSDLSAISEENAASNQQVSASVAEIAEAINSIASNSNSTNVMASDLTETVSYFK